MVGVSRKGQDMEEKETVLTSVEQLNEYLRENADDKSVISIVLEITGEVKEEEGGEMDG